MSAATFRRVLLASALTLAAAPAPTQEVSFRPALSLGASYDSNIFLVADQPRDDWYGHLTLDLPLQYKASSRSSLSARYLVEGEWYEEQKELSDFPTRQNANLNYKYGAARGWTFGLRGSYDESQRAEDVFPGSGIDFGRQRARSGSGGGSLGRSLGQYGRLGFEYDYTRSYYREDEQTNYHNASGTLGRQFGPRTRLDVKYGYDEYRFGAELPDGPTTISQVATLGFNQSLGQRTTFSLRGGVRFTKDQTTPEGDARLSYSWRGGSLFVSYAHTQAFVPARDAEDSLSEVDQASLGLAFRGRRYRISLTPSYYRNRVADFRSETWRGSFEAAYNFSRFLGLGVSYEHTFQESTDVLRDQSTRYVAGAKIVITPWPGPAGQAAPGKDTPAPPGAR